MLSSVVVAYFLQQFQQPVTMPFRQDRSMQHIRTVEQRGSLIVDASSAQTGTVPPGSQRVEMLTLRLTAGCEDDIPINAITVQRRGLGENSDIEAIYAIHRGARISQARAVNRRDGLVDLNVRRFMLPACESEDVVIYADFSTTASIAGEHRLELKGIDAGKATVRIEQRRGDFTRSRTTAGPPVGQISVEYLRINERIHYGTRQRLSRFTLSADSRDDHLIHAITFTNNGSASDDDLQHLFVEFRNRRVSNIVPVLSDDRVRLEFNPPLELPKNHTLKFGLRADVRASRSRTIQFVIEEPSDIEATPDRGR